MKQDYEITDRNLSEAQYFDAKRLGLTKKSDETIRNNVSVRLNSRAAKPSVRVYENVSAVGGGDSMDFTVHELNHFNAIFVDAKLLKTKNKDKIRDNGMKRAVREDTVTSGSYMGAMNQSSNPVVDFSTPSNNIIVESNKNEKDNFNSTATSSSYMEAMNQSLKSNPFVDASAPSNNIVIESNENETSYRLKSDHDISDKLNVYESLPTINVEDVDQKRNYELQNEALNSDTKKFDAREIEDKANNILEKEEHKSPMYGGSNSEIFTETSLNDKPIVTHEENVHDNHKVTNTNDLVSSLSENLNKKDQSEQNDELSYIHNKSVSGVNLVENTEKPVVISKNDTLEKLANADIDNMSVDDLRRLVDGFKRINEDTVHAEEENNRLESENIAYLEETRNLTSEVSEAKRRFIEEINRQKESSLKAQREASERHGKLVSEREALESKKTNVKAQLDEINKIRDEFSNVNSNSGRSR